MDGSQQAGMTPDDFDRELAGALRISPSGEFRARIRARVSGEHMRAGWWPQVPMAAYAGFAGLVVVVGLWLMSGSRAVSPVQMAGGTLPRAARDADGVPSGQGQPPRAAVGNASVNSPSSLAQDRERPPRPVARTHAAPLSKTPAVPASDQEVLLSESEIAGVRLLFESAASGRLRLPEDMLQDPTPPIVEARTSVPLLDQQSSDDRWKE